MTHAYLSTATLEEQIELETEMRSLGVTRFRESELKAHEAGQSTRAAPVRRLMIEQHEAVSAGIKAFIEAASSGKAGRKHVALGMFLEVDNIDMLAHLALRSVLDGITEQTALSRLAITLGRLIEDEQYYAAFERQEKKTFKAVTQKLKAASHHEGQRRKSARAQGSKAGVVFEGWDQRQMLLLGTKLIEIVAETTKLVRIAMHRTSATTTQYRVEATEETRAWIATESSRMEWLLPLYMPCIIPPKPWTTPFSGGYHSARVRRLTLLKTPDRAYLEELANQEMPEVYGAINALQDTAWAINQPVLDTMKAMWDANATLGGLIPDAEQAPLPVRPGWLSETMTKDDMTEEQQAAFRSWKIGCAKVYDDNADRIGHRMGFIRMLGVAERFAGREFFFPYQLDFRGRIYPVPLYLHPQGNDEQRGLLTFARGVEVSDDEGELWLAIHGAGCWGVDKLDLEARRAWVIEHEDRIIAAATYPLTETFWTEAEKPWQALAFCFEWAAYRREGYGFQSSLPVQMDGTCNGLQNFSAILKDSIGGSAVNLIPADKPQDIYARVAELVSKRVEADCLNEALYSEKEGAAPVRVCDLALGWLGKVNRKVCKRPVMTLAYGARQFGFKQQVWTDTVAPWRDKNAATFPWEGSGWVAADYMGTLIWQCVGEVVVAARAAMDWLQEAARIAAKEGAPVNWKTPCGLLVSQAYRLQDSKEVELTFSRVPLRLKLTQDRQKIDSRRQASGISPNWVHSLDAAHLMKTVNACHAEGVRSFSMIHDSYGTHAGNAWALATALRQQFVAMYKETDVLAEFSKFLQEQLPEGTKLPPLPPHGDLDLDLVLQSPFFFA